MSRNIASILMSLLFLVLIAAPSVVTLIDDSIDTSFFYDSGEEEEGSEKNKEKEVLLFELNFFESEITASKIKNNLDFFLKKYSKPHLNLVLPPPEVHTL